MSKEAYCVIVGFDCPSGKICDKILGAFGEDEIKEAAELHWQNWLKSLPRKKSLRWIGNFAQEKYLNIPYYRFYPASQFEEIKCAYPHHAEFLDNLYNPTDEDRAAKLIEMFKERAGRFGDGSSSYFLYAKEELEKMGYVYSYNESRWYPPDGIKV